MSSPTTQDLGAPITPPLSAEMPPKAGRQPGDGFHLPPAATRQVYILPKTETDEPRRGRAKLPPPPMRSRRIIQVQPAEDDGRPEPARARKPAKRGAASASASAVRKTARKIAHSAIERRRRCKMNEEFDSLKELVPSCRVATHEAGEQALHKLGILQATVDYLRYLEGCVAQLQSRLDKYDDDDVAPAPPLTLPARSDPVSRGARSRSRSPGREPEPAERMPSEPEDDDDDSGAESSAEVGRSLLMLGHAANLFSAAPTPAVLSPNASPEARGIRVSDLLG
ncbi:uncharacterized protein V1510DRAFT_410697 [Dipodascopsis tothii]|uniref:uncharacterized protein n=1 Tax=Dipodascopsis tothii TaxID=44089 RepID=UPI0034CF1D40